MSIHSLPWPSRMIFYAPRLARLLGLGIIALAAVACGATTPTALPTATPVPRTLATRFIPTLAPTYTRLPTLTPTLTPTPTSTPTPTNTPTITFTPTETGVPTVSPTRAYGAILPGVGQLARYSTPTPEPPCPAPETRTDVKEKIIFWSDRNLAAIATPTPSRSGRNDPVRMPNMDAVFVMNGDGSNQVQLGPSPKCAEELYDYLHERMSVSNDAKWVLTVEKSGSGTSVYIRDDAGKMVKRITTLDGFNYNPTWAPDQQRVAFVSQVDMNDEVYFVDIVSMQVRRLTFNTWEWDKHPSWTTDGRKIIFWSNRETQRKQIWMMNAHDGSQPINLSNNGFNDWDPIWVKP